VIKLGNVYTCGWSLHGQTGHGNKNDLNIFKKIDYFNSIPSHKKQIRQISSGGEHTMILTADGTVYVMGNFGKTDHLHPSAVSTLDHDDNCVTQITSGDFFGMMLTSKNNIYSFGDNERGQCGIGSSVRFAAEPTKVIFDSKIKTPVRKIIAGSSHAFTLCGERDEEIVYAWGRGEGDRLGLCDHGLNHFTPVQVPCLNGMKIKQIAASGMYTLFCNSEYVEDKSSKYLFHNLKLFASPPHEEYHYYCNGSTIAAQNWNRFSDVTFKFV
jgi:alpha-tubulin suppressor-like RCC1 family protein